MLVADCRFDFDRIPFPDMSELHFTRRRIPDFQIYNTVPLDSKEQTGYYTPAVCGHS